MRTSLGSIASLAALLLGCGARPHGGAAPVDDGVVYEANVTVLEAPGKPAMLCWNVMTSLPPQCGDIPTTNWSWDDVDGEETASGVTWGSYHVEGRYDGERFTVLQAGPPQPTDGQREEDAITSPCDPPSGGWTAPDVARATQADMDAAIERARAASDHAGVWIVQLDGQRGEAEPAPGRILLNAAFTGDVERHRTELAEVWGGPLCVVEHGHTLEQLTSIQTELGAQAKTLRLLSSSTDEVRNRVMVDVIFADADDQTAMDAKYGKGTVKLSSALRPKN
jgi:hypothetical protein